MDAERRHVIAGAGRVDVERRRHRDRRKAAAVGLARAELREHGYELDRGFGQAVACPLAGSRVLAGEQSRLDESLESVGENI